MRTLDTFHREPTYWEPMRRAFFAAGLVCLLACAASSALAHDQWLEPVTSRTAQGVTAEAHLFVGEAPFGDEEKVFERAKLSRLAIVSRNGAIDLLPSGVEGQKPLVSIPRLGDGEFVIAADRTPVLIELEPAKFEAYLVEEGLSRIVQERAARGETTKRGRERYTRYTKALLSAGEPVAHGMGQKLLGQKLEIVVESPLHPLRAGESIGVRVTFDGKPLAAAKVQASLRRLGAPPDTDAGSEELAATTDALGRATFRVEATGFLVLHLVHMRRCVERPSAPCPDADWESFWGSFTTAVR